MKNRGPCLLLWGLSTVLCQGQVTIDQPLVLSGVDTADRQVIGVGDATIPGDALNAGTARAASFRVADAAGSVNAWQVVTIPAFTTAPVPGTELVVRVQGTNTGPVTMDLAGAGTFPVVKGAGFPLDSGDVRPGLMAVLLFDGQAFQLTNGLRSSRRPCPSGFTEVSDQFCIEPGQRDTLDFRYAAIACGNVNATVCTWGEWHLACDRAAQLGLTDMIGDWEWTNSSASSDMYVRVVGLSSCTVMGVELSIGGAPLNFRCCYRR
ncbi:MAG: hypothetical protein IPG10_05865 [Flavobacteriales bacterium]|nr:hypothetical protein [Flavobacteriales bacterium]MBK6754948.1 hypothetical protein [Flavobacteriales bacterium]MBK7753205.1 hypothetical protein [Flavobacteriales bacterium]MBK9540201.1 hypothetical protein [Flavobacteriales bacterium]